MEESEKINEIIGSLLKDEADSTDKRSTVFHEHREHSQIPISVLFCGHSLLIRPLQNLVVAAYLVGDIEANNITKSPVVALHLWTHQQHNRRQCIILGPTLVNHLIALLLELIKVERHRYGLS
jgi:hypothetical protein